MNRKTDGQLYLLGTEISLAFFMSVKTVILVYDLPQESKIKQDLHCEFHASRFSGLDMKI